MSSEQRLLTVADLQIVEAALANLTKYSDILEKSLQTVSKKIEKIQHAQNQTDEKLSELMAEFREFIATDLRAKNLQLAETRIIKVRQDLEIKFGHYKEARRICQGVLPAVQQLKLVL